MEENTLKKANEILYKIERERFDIETINNVGIRDNTLIKIGNDDSFFADASLLSDIVELALRYKKDKLAKLKKELKKL